MGKKLFIVKSLFAFLLLKYYSIYSVLKKKKDFETTVSESIGFVNSNLI